MLTLVAVLLPGGGQPALAAPLDLVEPVEVSASSQEGEHVPRNTPDSDPTTRWSAEGDDAWIGYELGTPRRLCALDVAWYDDDRRTTRFSAETSSDGESWQAVELLDDDTAGAASEDRQRVAFEVVEARFVRVVGSGTTTNGWTSITELTVEAEPFQRRVGPAGADGGGAAQRPQVASPVPRRARRRWEAPRHRRAGRRAPQLPRGPPRRRVRRLPT